MGGRLKIRTRRVPGAPIAALRVWLCGGERNARRPGEALLAGRMLEEGTESRSWRQVAADAEDRGIVLSAASGYEVMGLALDGPQGELDRMIAWGYELALSPRFDADRWEWQRQLAAAELASLDDDPEAVTERAFLDQIYGDHPRGRPLAGSQATLSRLAVDDSRRSHRQAVSSGLIVALAGAIDEERDFDRLEELFSGRGAKGAETPLEPVESPGRGLRRQVDLPGEQAHLLVGRQTVTRDHPDLPALELSAVVLGAGAGLAGRIPERVREREGLAYTASVDTAAGASVDRGRLAIHVATSADRVERAERTIREELGRYVADGATAEELEAARSFLEGQELFRRETGRQWAELLAEAEATGIAVDEPGWAAARWSRVSLGDLRAAAERWLDPTALVVTAGLPRSG